jgi:hypothetical protein
VIRLRIPPFTSGQNLRNNLPLPPLLIRQFRNLPRYLLLLGIMVEDAGAVLRADVWTLAVRSGGVVHFVEEFEELAVGYLRGVVDDLKGFGVYLNVSTYS